MTKWKIDTVHSELLFKIRYLKLTDITGRVGDFQLEFQTQDELMKTIHNLAFSVPVDSINTFNKERDKMLQSAEFFDAENYHTITFKGNKIDYLGKEPPFNFATPYMKDYRLYGDLTIKGVTKPITLNIIFEGLANDEDNAVKAGFSFNTRISRKEFGIGWEKLTHAHRFVLSDEVEIKGQIQLFRGN